MTLKIEGGTLVLDGISLQEIILNAYREGQKNPFGQDNQEIVTFIQLSKELAEKGRKLSVSTLTRKARSKNIKIVPFDGKRLGCYKVDVKKFISPY